MDIEFGKIDQHLLLAGWSMLDKEVKSSDELAEFQRHFNALLADQDRIALDRAHDCRAVRIDSQQSRRAVVDARTRQTRYQRMMVTRSDRSFVCDARTPLYHTLTHDKIRTGITVPSVTNSIDGA
ncbi:hypothetical protein T07_8581 [Trichinella nelsoni]|uniref:Uncharacterized protein n=1 Tax=Trichinella nelsoni TaxID=6336 RepID=A0A0V0RSF4_9BILA|nr:hypothetical protein T07_8581 [Trichinella nelsoni]